MDYMCLIIIFVLLSYAFIPPHIGLVLVPIQTYLRKLGVL